jgi:anti-sigma B factor antagonist
MVRSDRATSLILDLASVPYVDSAGVGCLMNGYVSHQNAGRTLYLVGVTPRVRTTLRVTNVEQFFPMFATLEEAERGITG